MSLLIARPIKYHASITRQNLFFRSQFLCIKKQHVSTRDKPQPSKVVQETTKAVSAGNKAISPHANTAVNPPESTLPPNLDIPERQQGQGTVGYYFKVGKSYIGFYKTALKAVLSNYRESNTIVSRIPAKDSKGARLSFASAAKSGFLTRSEFQFILRSRRDIKKLPLLGLLLIICGEYLPLIVIFVSGLVPRTAWIPKQTERARTKIETRRAESFRAGTLEGDNTLTTIGRNQSLEDLTPPQILHLSRSLGLHSTFWETFWDRPPQWLARSRARKAIEYLSVDDYTIHRDGGVGPISDEEIKMACEERGIDVLKQEVSTLRKHLNSYMRLRVNDNIGLAAMVLVRPSQWAELGNETK